MRKEYININNDIKTLNLLSTGIENCAPDFSFPPTKRNSYIIHYVYGGVGSFLAGDRHFSLKKGDIFIISPDTFTSYCCTDPDNPMSFCWVSFNGTFVSEYLVASSIPRTSEALPISLTDGERFKNDIEKIFKYTSEADSISSVKLNSYLLSCLSILQSAFSGSPVNKTPDYISTAIAFIETNYMLNITVKDIVNYVNLDRSYFFRLFKSAYGTSPQSYLIKYRIQKSCELIKFTDYSIKKIAECVGITDIYYFSKLFKSITGVSPTAYRKNI